MGSEVEPAVAGGEVLERPREDLSGTLELAGAGEDDDPLGGRVDVPRIRRRFVPVGCPVRVEQFAPVERERPVEDVPGITADGLAVAGELTEDPDGPVAPRDGLERRRDGVEVAVGVVDRLGEPRPLGGDGQGRTREDGDGE